MKTTILTTVLVILSLGLFAQVSINTDGSDPDGSAMLEVKSTDKGFLPPRVANVNDVSNPVAGLQVYDQSVNCMRYYNGTVWSECMGKPFICGDPFMDSRDGKVYNSVQIGTQCWMAKNLNIGTRIDGSGNQSNNDTIEKYCYDDNPTNCNTYGGLYQWNEMMQYVTTEGVQGICPTGWHLPSDDEYKTLEMELGMSQAQADATGYRGTDQGSQLAGNESLWLDGPLDQNGAFGNSGFAVLPAGYRYTSGSFNALTNYAYLWSSTELGSNAWDRHLYYYNTDVNRYFFNKAFGFSVRCVRD